MLNLTPSGIKLTPTGVKINTNLVWTSHNTGAVEFNTRVFAVNIVIPLSRIRANGSEVVLSGEPLKVLSGESFKVLYRTKKKKVPQA